MWCPLPTPPPPKKEPQKVIFYKGPRYLTEWEEINTVSSLKQTGHRKNHLWLVSETHSIRGLLSWFRSKRPSHTSLLFTRCVRLWRPIRSGTWSHSVLCGSLQSHRLQPTGLLRPWNFPGKSPGVGCHFLLQGNFPTWGSNPGLLHGRQTLYALSHQGSPGAN